MDIEFDWDKAAFKSRLETALDNVRVEKKALAEHLGFQDQSPLSAWLTTNKKTVPTVQQILDSANYLGVYPGWLGFGEYPLPKSAEELMDVLMNEPDLMKKLFMLISAYFTSPTFTPPVAETIPPGTMIEKHETGQRLYTPPAKPETKPQAGVASEPTAPYTRPVVKNIKPVNRRADYTVYSIKRGGHTDPEAAPGWFNLVAGPGGYLERSEDLWIIPKLSRARGINHAVVRGHSMLETLQPGDLILLQGLANGEGIRLPSLEPGQPKTPVDHFKREVPNDEIYALSLDNGQTVTIKRVIYQLGKGGRWHMLIVADNPAEWESYVVREEDEVIFYAKMIGFGKE